MDRIIVDRSRRDAARAVGATSFLFVLVLPMYSRDLGSLADLLVGGVVGIALATVGFGLASRVRPAVDLENESRQKLAARAVVVGSLIGVANLAVNFGLASLDHELELVISERLEDISAFASVLAAPVVEEVVFRLFVLSAIGFCVARVISESTAIAWVAIVVSAILFGVLHAMRPMPVGTDLARLYASGVVLKSSIAAVPLGWIYWRWGLPYAIIAHSAANGAHWLIEPLVLPPL